MSEPTRKTLAGKLTISRQMNARDDEAMPISITLHDESSGLEVAEVRVGLAAFAEALTGVARLACVFELNSPAIPLVGTRHEVKFETVWISGKSYCRGDKWDVAVAVALAPLEVDGWRGSAYDAGNHHNHVHGKTPPPGEKEGTWAKVAFHRYVSGQKAR